MNIIVAGNKNYGLAKGISEEYPFAKFCSRSSGYDFENNETIKIFSEECLNYDVVILCSALYKFKQSILLKETFEILKNNKKNNTRIIVIGSTVDRVKRGSDWLYMAEKKALRDLSNSLSLMSVWQDCPRVTLISFGTMENVQHKHPDRKTLKIKDCVFYIKWLLEQPTNIHINEISIDPIQKEISN